MLTLPLLPNDQPLLRLCRTNPKVGLPGTASELNSTFGKVLLPGPCPPNGQASPSPWHTTSGTVNSQDTNTGCNGRLLELCVLCGNGQTMAHGQFQVSRVVTAELVAHGQLK